MKWYAVYFEDNKIRSVVEIPAEKDGHGIVCVQARGVEHAKKLAFNFYCKEKKKLAIARLYSHGQCRCGRKQDRLDEGFKTCSVCAVRGAAKKHRVGQTRDEGARVETNLVRQRDRKGEIRLEVLVEVRNKWRVAQNMRLFEKWLEQEIDKCAIPNRVAAE